MREFRENSRKPELSRISCVSGTFSPILNHPENMPNLWFRVDSNFIKIVYEFISHRVLS